MVPGWVWARVRAPAQRTARACFSTATVGRSAWPTAPRTVDRNVQASQPITLSRIAEKGTQQEPIVCITAYDYPTGLAVRAAGADICLVGDSLANVALGHGTTRALTLDQMVHHGSAVRDAIRAPELRLDPLCPPEPILVVDMPFGTCAVSVEEGVHNVLQVVRATQAHAVKIEGSQEILPLVKKLTSHGIAVMGHVGLQPQRYGDAASLRLQAAHAESAYALYEDLLALQDAGCFSVVLECIPSKIGELISQRLQIPTIGIGAGPHTHGQVLVGSDIVSDLESPAHVSAALRTEQRPASVEVPQHTEWPVPPKFVRGFAPTNLGALRVEAFRRFADAVRSRTFPDNATESYRIKSHELAAFQAKLAANTPK